MVDAEQFQPVILAGGKGTRLRSVVSDRPKILATVNGRPFITYLLDELFRQGFTRVVISVGYMADLVIETLGNNCRGVQIDYVREKEPLGTGGGLRQAYDFLKGRPILALNGDSFCTLDFNTYIKNFREGCVAGLALTYVQNSSRYGTVSYDHDGIVTDFKEKDPTAGAGWINAGIYLLKSDVFSLIPKGKNISIERDVFPQLLGKQIFAWPEGKDFIDIGLPETYQAAEAFFKELKTNE